MSRQKIDLLLTHTAPAATQPSPKGSVALDVVVDSGIARAWCHGHSVELDEIVEQTGTQIIPLHHATFDRLGSPGNDARCHLTFEADGSVVAVRALPSAWRKLRSKNWIERPDGQLIAR